MTQPSVAGNERCNGRWGKVDANITSNSSIVVFSSWTFKSFCVSSSPGSWPPTSSLRYCWSILSKAAFRSFLNPWERWKIIASLKFHQSFTWIFTNNKYDSSQTTSQEGKVCKHCTCLLLWPYQNYNLNGTTTITENHLKATMNSKNLQKCQQFKPVSPLHPMLATTFLTSANSIFY